VLREKLILQEKFLLELSRDLTKRQRGKLSRQTSSVVSSLKRRAALIRREVREVITNLPTVVLTGCPSCDGSFRTSFDLEEISTLTRNSSEFLKVAKRAINERLKVDGPNRPCDSACIARVRARRLAASKALKLARELAQVTERIIKGTPRIDTF
jgi:hypothetical protein